MAKGSRTLRAPAILPIRSSSSACSIAPPMLAGVSVEARRPAVDARTSTAVDGPGAGVGMAVATGTVAGGVFAACLAIGARQADLADLADQ